MAIGCSGLSAPMCFTTRFFNCSESTRITIHEICSHSLSSASSVAPSLRLAVLNHFRYHCENALERRPSDQLSRDDLLASHLAFSRQLSKQFFSSHIQVILFYDRLCELSRHLFGGTAPFFRDYPNCPIFDVPSKINVRILLGHVIRTSNRTLVPRIHF
jgi:hypothetical protein